MKHIALAIITAHAFIAAPADAAVDYFLELEGIAGEVETPGHVGHITIEAFGTQTFQRALQNAASASGANGKPVIRPITITKSVDKSSPQLFLACVTGLHIKKAVFYADYINAPGESGPVGTFLKITLNNVRIGSVTHEAGNRGGNGDLLESVSLNFARIEIEYRAITDGTLGAPVKTTCNLAANK